MTTRIHGRRKSKGLKCAGMVLGLFIVWFVAHSAVIIADGLNDEIAPCDAVVVLGNEVLSGSEPSARLAARLDIAADLFRSRVCGAIITSGGIDPAGNDEAEVMKGYLVRKGIPPESILTDSAGINTRATAQNVGRMMNAHGMKSIAVVSQYYHITRTRLALSQIGMNKVYSAHARILELRDVYSVAREFFAYYSYLIRY